jgi:4-amino-4-deoxy-L-arabinose transferase-like glycosyltransferase
MLLVISYFALFHHLDRLPMHLWDESSYALNAQAMLENGNFIELYLLDKPDLYNSKPPFAIWCMAFGIHFFGFTEIGVRIASASFALLTILLLFGLGLKLFKNGLYALAMPLVLLSSLGYVNEHIARTGDTDSILAFWITAQCVCFYVYTLSNSNKRNWYLLSSAVCIVMGCLTKGMAGLTALPGIITWLFISKSQKHFFSSWAFYTGVVLFMVMIGGYYFIRNWLTPGYLDAVMNFEVGGRLLQQEFLNPEYRPFYYFYQSMVADGRLSTWIFILPVSVGYILYAAKSETQQLGTFLIVALLGVSFSLAFSSTKLFWYDAPLYPLIAGVIGVSIVLLLEQTHPHLFWLFLAIFSWPYYLVIANNMNRQSASNFAIFFKSLRAEKYTNDTIYIINADPNFPLHFYQKQDKLNGNYSMVVHPMDSILQPGVNILIEKHAREVDMKQKFVLETIETFKECSYAKIRQKK